MTDLIDIVPRSASPVERAAVQMVDSRSRYLPRVQSIIDVRYLPTIPADVLPWLLRHWGLEDAAAFATDHQRLYDEGKRWQTLRGRVEAYQIILNWLGITGQYERGDHGDVRWGLFQIGLDAPPSRPDLVNLIGLANLSKRASSKLGRVYGGYDVRAFRFDESLFDDALFDDWSGVYIDGIEPKLSFGTTVGGVIEFLPTLHSGRLQLNEGVARFEEGFVFDRSRFDDEIFEPSVVVIQAAFSGDLVVPAEVLPPWPNRTWPTLTWNDLQPYLVYGGPEPASAAPPEDNGSMDFSLASQSGLLMLLEDLYVPNPGASPSDGLMDFSQASQSGLLALLADDIYRPATVAGPNDGNMDFSQTSQSGLVPLLDD